MAKGTLGQEDAAASVHTQWEDRHGMKMVLFKVYVHVFSDIFLSCRLSPRSVFEQKECFRYQGFVINMHDKVCTPGSVFNEAIWLPLSGLNTPTLNSLAAASLGSFVNSGLCRGGGSLWCLDVFEITFELKPSDSTVVSYL